MYTEAYIYVCIYAYKYVLAVKYICMSSCEAIFNTNVYHDHSEMTVSSIGLGSSIDRRIISSKKKTLSGYPPLMTLKLF